MVEGRYSEAIGLTVVPGFPFFRFKCSGCDAERDQKMRNSESKTIKCVCGEKAWKTGDSPPEDEQLKRWMYANGEPAPGMFRDNEGAGEAVAGLFSGHGPIPKEKPKSIIERLLRK